MSLQSIWRHTEDNDIDTGAVLPFVVVQGHTVLASVTLLGTLTDQHCLVRLCVNLEALCGVYCQATLKTKQKE